MLPAVLRHCQLSVVRLKSWRIPVGGMQRFSSGCGGRGVALLQSMLAMPCTVSVAAQKKGGDSDYPIWRLVGTTMSGSSLVAPGST